MDRVPLGSASIKLTTIHLSPKIGGKGEAIPPGAALEYDLELVGVDGAYYRG